MGTQSPNCMANNLAHPHQETSAQQPFSAFRGHPPMKHSHQDTTAARTWKKVPRKPREEKSLNDIVMKPTIKAGAMTRCYLWWLKVQKNKKERVNPTATTITAVKQMQSLRSHCSLGCRQPVPALMLGHCARTVRQTFPKLEMTVRSAEPQGHLCPPCCSDL